MSIERNWARKWFGLGGGTIALTFMLGAALGCDQSGSTSDAQFMPATGPDGAAKPDDSPVPAGPPATAAELAQLPLVDAGARQASDTNVLLNLDGRGELQSGTAPPAKVLWWQIEGPPAQIADPSALQSAILVPDLTAPSLLKFRLAVWDADGRVNADTTTVLVQPQPMFARVAGAVVTEDSEAAVFTVRLSEPASGPLALRYRTLEGTAREHVDFVPVAGAVEFATGATEALVRVQLLDDTQSEGFKSFSLEITTSLNETGVFNSGVMLIVNGEEPTLTQSLRFGTEPVLLRVGQSVLVEPDTSAAPGTGELRWVSSDSEIALVDGVTGEVTATAPGFATITVHKEHDRDYLGAHANYQLQVIAAELLPQELVFELDGPQTLFLDQTLINEAIECEGGDGELRYVSSRPEIASVDEHGKITPHAPGVAVITAIKAASEGYAEARIEYPLTVELRPTPLSSLPRRLQLQPGESGFIEIVEAGDNGGHQPGGAEPGADYCDLFNVTSSDSTVVKVASSPVQIIKDGRRAIRVKVTAIEPGAATITVAKAAEGAFAAGSVAVEIEVLPVPQ